MRKTAELCQATVGESVEASSRTGWAPQIAKCLSPVNPARVCRKHTSLVIRKLSMATCILRF